MSIEQTDDDEAMPMDGLLPAELQQEFEQLLADNASRAAPLERLTPELEQLEADIGMARGLRKLHGDEVPLYRFGRFEVLSSVRGGMGLVLEARDPQLERLVAIKLWLRSGPEWQAALLAEAKLLAKLEHANVVRVYEPGIWKDAHVYFVMEWIEGVDGHDWLERPRSWREALPVFIAAAKGLAAAHEAGIHHRDFKPSNVLIGDDGRVVIADFGVAESLCPSSDRDELGKAPGTPAYMAPERLRGRRGDARSDQFSFCATLWRALYGQRPFVGETREELAGAIERGELQEDASAGVPAWLIEVVRKGLAVDPEERFPDMRALIAALHDDPSAEQGTVRERWPFFAIGLLAGMVVVMGAWMVSSPPAEPVAGAVQFEPYHVILGVMAADEFVEVQRLYRRHEAELSDAQSLQIAGACLQRANELGSDCKRASQAAVAALEIANEVQKFGESPEARKAGGQLVAEAEAFVADHPPDLPK